MDAKIKEQLEQIEYYRDLILVCLKTHQPYEAAAWCRALSEEALKLKTMLEK